MTYTYDNTVDTFLIVGFTFIIIFFVILILYFNIISPFIKSREYIKMEMQRSDGREYLYWKRQLKKLYMTSIPIIGRFFR